MSFKVQNHLIKNFLDQKPPFGFNGLGKFVYDRTYSRIKHTSELNVNTKECWFDTVLRVVNGTYSLQKSWISQNKLGWNEEKAQSSAARMFSKIYNMKFLPPGRGLWAMGTPITEGKKIFAALNNCAFVSTENISVDKSRPFCFLMDMSMLGIGVGFDTKGAGKLIISEPGPEMMSFVIDDSREGWVDSLKILIDSFFTLGSPKVEFIYSEIRPKNQDIKSFGGKTSGPEPLNKMHDQIREVLEACVGKPLTSRTIVDICNIIGCCVISGNVRRTAEIAFGSVDDYDFINLKNYKLFPERAEYGWTSNNSIFAQVGMDYSKIVDQIRENGEPGIAWLDNMKNYSRMNGSPDYKDIKVAGGNPCLEQSLESYELCCLVECFPTNCTDVDDFLDTLKYAFLYAKSVTLGQIHWPESDKIVKRNRRIGCSLTGVAQFLGDRGADELRNWTEEGYAYLKQMDGNLSRWMNVPESIKITSIKPSGTVSILAGVTPGIHYPISRFYIRRVRVSDTSELLPQFEKSGYKIEKDKYSANTMIIEFPVDCGEGVRTLHDVNMIDQMEIAAFMQKYWADNQVSCTVTFDPETEGPFIADALQAYETKLKGISFLPQTPAGAYEQMPYEEIDEETYNLHVARLKNLDIISGQDANPEIYCDGDSCTKNM